MATRVFMPKAGMDMETGTIVQWFKKEGEPVKAGEPLLEIETDKVNLEIEAPDSGVLLKIVHRQGETVPVTQTIAWIGETGEIVIDEAPANGAKPERR
jgi:dihydrolipoamide dehydrogenase